MFLKLFLQGVDRVGKTQLLNRFCTGFPFSGQYTRTAAPDFAGTKLKLRNGQQAIVQVWDCPGGSRAQSLQRFYVDTHCCILGAR